PSGLPGDPSRPGAGPTARPWRPRAVPERLVGAIIEVRAERQARSKEGHRCDSTFYDGGVNFSLFSRGASGVELLLFERDDDARPARVIRFDPRANLAYHYW